MADAVLWLGKERDGAAAHWNLTKAGTQIMPQSPCHKGTVGLSVIQSLLVINTRVIISTPASLQQTGDLLVKLQGTVAAAAMNARSCAEKKAARQRAIDSALSTIDRIAQAGNLQALNQLNGEFAAGSIGPPCDESAELYLSTGLYLLNGGNGSIGLEIEGNVGLQQFTFASGTAMVNIIAAINSFTESIGVTAAQSVENNVRIELRSVEVGSDQFVIATQLSGLLPIIFAEPIGGRGVFELTDFGRDGIPGDLNCDWIVDVVDVQLLLADWGPCPEPPDDCPADLNNDGTVGITDLLILLANWG